MNDDTQFWLQRIRAVAGLADCELPSGLKLYGQSPQVRMQLPPNAALANMQDDHAAFEAWSLALHVHCGIDAILLDLSKDEPLTGPHPNRFKYRFAKFGELFPSLLLPDAGCEWLLTPIAEDCELKINKSYSRSALPRMDCWEAMGDAKGEARLELGLEVSPAFRRAFQLSTVMRQWPVGIFRDSVSRESGLLPRHKSAIDLIGVGAVDHALHLFELKKHDNRAAGIVSELFFYSAVMRDVLLGKIRYQDERAASNCTLAPSEVLRRKEIQSVFITNGRHHPLVEQGALLDTLNVAARRWADIPVKFTTAKIRSEPTKIGEDFEFA